MSVSVNPDYRGAEARIPEDIGISTGAAKDDVENVINYAQTKTDDMLGKLEDIRTALTDLMKNFDVKDISTNIGKVNYNKINFPGSKAWAEIDLNKNWPKDLPIKPQFKNFGNLDFEYILPVSPEELKASFSWKGEEYESQNQQKLFVEIYNFFAGGTQGGLPIKVHEAILSKEKNARLRNQAKQMRTAMMAAGENGFFYGQGSPATNGLIAEMLKAQVYADQDALNELTRLDYESARKDREFFLSLSVDIEKLMSDRWSQEEERRLEADKFASDFLIKVKEQALAVYLGKVEGILKEADIFKTKIEAISANNKALSDQYLAEFEGYGKQVDAVASENTSKVQIRGIEVDTWFKKVQAATAQQSASLAGAEFDFRQLLAKVENDLKVHQINTEGYKIESELKSSINTAIAKIFAQATASIIGTINATATLGFRGAETKTHTLTDSARFSESLSV